MKRLAVFAFVVGLLTSGATAATASPIILASNLNAAQDSFSFESLTYWEADSFMTPGGGPFLITSVLAAVSLSDQAQTAPDFALQLRDDNAGLPGSVIGTLTPASPIPFAAPGAFPFTTFTPTSAIELLSNTTYWLSVSTTTPFTSPVYWAWNGDALQTQEGLGIVTGFWTSSGNQGGSWEPVDEGPNIFQIEGTVVPEPATLLLLGSGLAIRLARRRTIRR